MFFVKTRIGDEIVIRTPTGDIRLLIGGADNRSRQLGISAPDDFKIIIPSRGPRPPAPTLTLPSDPGCAARGE